MTAKVLLPVALATSSVSYVQSLLVPSEVPTVLMVAGVNFLGRLYWKGETGGPPFVTFSFRVAKPMVIFLATKSHLGAA
jgi:hypothetical protein